MSSIGGQFLGAASKKKQSKAASQAIQQGSNAAINVRNQGTTAAVNTLAPWIQGGLDAANAGNALLGLGGDTAAATEAFNNYLNSAGYQFQLGQGTKAVTGSAAAKGLLNSGATAKALNEYGQNVASTYFQNYLNNLNTSAGRGAAAASDTANLWSNWGNAQANTYTGAATQMAEAKKLGAGAYLQAGQNAADSIVKTFGNALSFFGGAGG